MSGHSTHQEVSDGPRGQGRDDHGQRRRARLRAGHRPPSGDGRLRSRAHRRRVDRHQGRCRQTVRELGRARCRGGRSEESRSASDHRAGRRPLDRSDRCGGARGARHVRPPRHPGEQRRRSARRRSRAGNRARRGGVEHGARREPQGDVPVLSCGRARDARAQRPGPHRQHLVQLREDGVPEAGGLLRLKGGSGADDQGTAPRSSGSSASRRPSPWSWRHTASP